MIIIVANSIQNRTKLAGCFYTLGKGQGENVETRSLGANFQLFTGETLSIAFRFHSSLQRASHIYIISTDQGTDTDFFPIFQNISYLADYSSETQ
jgi:hypothetical protein